MRDTKRMSLMSFAYTFGINIIQFEGKKPRHKTQKGSIFIHYFATYIMIMLICFISKCIYSNFTCLIYMYIFFVTFCAVCMNDTRMMWLDGKNQFTNIYRELIVAKSEHAHIIYMSAAPPSGTRKC